MKSGFENEKLNKLSVVINDNKLNNLVKKYKHIKKYMKSSLYEIKKIDGSEKIVSDLLKELEPESDGKALST